MTGAMSEAVTADSNDRRRDQPPRLWTATMGPPVYVFKRYAWFGEISSVLVSEGRVEPIAHPFALTRKFLLTWAAVPGEGSRSFTLNSTGAP